MARRPRVALLMARGPKVKLLPNDIAETTAQCERGRSSWWGAFAFFFLFSASIVVSLGQALYVIYYPNSC